jgi:hypothetical protein
LGVALACELRYRPGRELWLCSIAAPKRRSDLKGFSFSQVFWTHRELETKADRIQQQLQQWLPRKEILLKL